MFVFLKPYNRGVQLMARGPKSGPGAEVLWSTENARFSSITVFERYSQGRIKGTVQ